MLSADERKELAAIVARYDAGLAIDEVQIGALASAVRAVLGARVLRVSIERDVSPENVEHGHPARIVDVRLVLDRDDRTRTFVDGRPVLTFDSSAEAFMFLAAFVAHRAPAEQLEALRAPEGGHAA